MQQRSAAERINRVVAGTYGSTTQAPVIVVDASGSITAISNATVASSSPYTVSNQRYYAQMSGVTTTIAAYILSLAPTGTATTSFAQSESYINYASSTAANSFGGWFFNTAHTEFQLQDDTTMVVKTGAAATDIQGIRIVFGFAQLNNAFDASNTGGTNSAAVFRFSTSAADVNWQALTNDGSGTTTITDTGIVVASNTRYILRIVFRDSTHCDFYINGTLVATNTTRLPTATSTMGFYMGFTNLTAGTARNIKIAKVEGARP